MGEGGGKSRSDMGARRETDAELEMGDTERGKGTVREGGSWS